MPEISKDAMRVIEQFGEDAGRWKRIDHRDPPPISGIYAIFAAGKPIYVGQAINLRRLLRFHALHIPDPRGRDRRDLREYYITGKRFLAVPCRIQVWICETDKPLLKTAEFETIRRLDPVLNIQWRRPGRVAYRR